MKTTHATILAAAALALAGCRVIDYEHAGRHVRIVSFGNDTKIGKLEAKTPEGSIVIENFDSQAKAMEAVTEAIKRIPAKP